MSTSKIAMYVEISHQSKSGYANSNSEPLVFHNWEMSSLQKQKQNSFYQEMTTLENRSLILKWNRPAQLDWSGYQHIWSILTRKSRRDQWLKRYLNLLTQRGKLLQSMLHKALSHIHYDVCNECWLSSLRVYYLFSNRIGVWFWLTETDLFPTSFFFN